MVSQKTTKKSSSKKVATKAAPQKAVKKISKQAVKKAATEKSAHRISKQKVEKVLVCASDDTCFWTTDGAILKDLQELSAALGAISESAFNHHVSKDKNDFAEWVEHVLKDAECAAALRRARKPKTARKVVLMHLRTYTL